MNTKTPGIIVALDGLTKDTALALARRLASEQVIFKVNDLLDGPEGIKIIGLLNKHGRVMDDPKFHDIPKTIERRIAKHAQMTPVFITVHASGGIEMMRSAVKSCGQSKIIAVTVLTSMNEEECFINLGAPVKAKVLQYARNAVLAGAHGIVCSAQELEFLSKFPELDNLIKVTPGIRPVWHLDSKDDQARVVTPAKAVQLKTDYIVIGRPVVNSEDPLGAVRRTKVEITEAVPAKKIS